jgi:hypothetical protein
MKVGRLTFIRRTVLKKGNDRLCEFLCDCGSVVYRIMGRVKYAQRRGYTMSCGCHLTRHYMTKSREHNSWTDMKQRCFNRNCTKFSYYGGRGITVCDSWRDSFENFLADMGPRPDGTSIDRIDVNGNYEPSNCRWATKTVQSINTRLKCDNRSGSRGVSWCKQTNKWRVTISVNGKQFHGGRFILKEEALAERIRMEKIYHKPLVEHKQTPCRGEKEYGTDARESCAVSSARHPRSTGGPS